MSAHVSCLKLLNLQELKGERTASCAEFCITLPEIECASTSAGEAHCEVNLEHQMTPPGSTKELFAETLLAKNMKKLTSAVAIHHRPLVMYTIIF